MHQAYFSLDCVHCWWKVSWIPSVTTFFSMKVRRMLTYEGQGRHDVTWGWMLGQRRTVNFDAKPVEVIQSRRRHRPLRPLSNIRRRGHRDPRRSSHLNGGNNWRRVLDLGVSFYCAAAQFVLPPFLERHGCFRKRSTNNLWPIRRWLCVIGAHCGYFLVTMRHWNSNGWQICPIGSDGKAVEKPGGKGVMHRTGSYQQLFKQGATYGRALRFPLRAKQTNSAKLPACCRFGGRNPDSRCRRVSSCHSGVQTWQKCGEGNIWRVFRTSGQLWDLWMAPSSRHTLPTHKSQHNLPILDQPHAILARLTKLFLPSRTACHP